MMLSRSLALIPLITLLSVPSWGQVELFGPDQAPVIEGGSDAQKTSTDEPSVVPLADNDPLLKQLLEQAGRGNQQLAASIGSLATLQRWQEADQLLQSIPGKQLDEATLAQMFLTIGADNYLRLKRPEILSDQGNQSLDALQAAATSYSESSQRLLQAIEELVAEDEDTRLQATRTLLSGGTAAIEQLVSACCKPQPNAKLNRMLSTLVALGGGGTDALRQMALYGTPECRQYAIHSLARIDLEKNIIDLATAAHAQDSTQPERGVAESQLERGQSFPSRSETLQALTLDLEQLAITASRQLNDGSIRSLWSINESRDGVTIQNTPTYLASYRDVYDAAARLQRFGQLTGETEALTILHTIGYELMADPDWGDQAQVDRVTQRFEVLSDAQSVLDILAIALRDDLIPGAIGLVRIISNTAWTPEQQKQFVRGTSGSPSSLVQAAVADQTQLRYEATSAISKLDQQSSYPGVSQVRRTLSEMARLGENPTAILVETRPEYIQDYEQLLRGMGFNVLRASSVSQAQRLVDQGGDLRLILAKQQLSDRTAIELIDTVRRTFRGRRIAIGIYGEEKIDVGAHRWNAPTAFLFDPVTEVTLGQLIERSKHQSHLPPLSPVDRGSFRQLAENELL